MLRSKVAFAFVAAVVASLPLIAPSSASTAGSTARVSVSETGGNTNGQSSRAVISPDGTAAGYYSNATNITTKPEYGAYDVFEVLLPSLTTKLVSYAYDGGAANGLSTYPAVSNNGDYVAFMSAATNIMPGDTNGKNDIFRRNMNTGVVQLVSVNKSGGFGGGTRPTISADGRFVAWNAAGHALAGSPRQTANNVYVRDMVSGTTKLVTGAGNKESIRPMISPDGSTVTFMSSASNLDPQATDTDGGYDVYQADLGTGAIRLVSATPQYTAGGGSATAGDSDSRATVSATGRFVVFESNTNNLVAGDTNGVFDAFRRDMNLSPGAPGAMIRISVRFDGSQANGASTRPTVSGDGHLVAFASNDARIVKGDYNKTRDVFMRNLTSGTNTAVSVTLSGVTGDCAGSAAPASSISPVSPLIRAGAPCIASRPEMDLAGDKVLFVSGFTNLVVNDTNGVDDIFVRTYPSAP